ncbi:MAG: ferritin family protein [bacterium]|nr:ferritin family protein [bacterium]
MINFTPTEALEFAIRIEENGEHFYRKLAEKVEEKEVKDLFIYLANEEVAHKSTYADMLKDIENYQPEENYPEEYFAYLRAYVEKVIFFPERLEKELKRIRDKDDAIDFAIRIELENILYFEELKKLVKSPKRQMIDKIIAEEQSHFLKLSGMKSL